MKPRIASFVAAAMLWSGEPPSQSAPPVKLDEPWADGFAYRYTSFFLSPEPCVGAIFA
jgi:hypothetical protein